MAEENITPPDEGSTPKVIRATMQVVGGAVHLRAVFFLPPLELGLNTNKQKRINFYGVDQNA